MKRKQASRRWRPQARLGVGIAALVIATLGFGGAAAAGSAGFTTTVTSGSSSWVDSAATPSHPWTNLSVRQDGSSPGTPGEYRFVNVNTGAVTSSKVSFGGLQTWAGVVSGTHRLQVRRQTPADTNGWLPGSGNTNFNGVIFW